MTTHTCGVVDDGCWKAVDNILWHVWNEMKGMTACKKEVELSVKENK